MAKQPWKNPPLALAVAGLQFDEILSFDSVLRSFQDEIRSFLPGYTAETVETVQHTTIAQVRMTQQRHVFRSADSTTAVVIGNVGLLLATSRYELFEILERKYLRPVLDALEFSVNGPLLIRRYGLRYIDRIVPTDGEKAEDYVVSNLRHDLAKKLGESTNEVMGLSLSRCQMPLGFMDVRFYTGLGPPPLPSDLLPSPVVDDMPLGAFSVEKDRRTAVIDSDRFFDVSEALDVERAVERYNMLHNDVSNVFRTIITKHALKVWA